MRLLIQKSRIMKTIHYLLILALVALINASIHGTVNLVIMIILVIAMIPVAGRMDKEAGQKK